MKVTRELGDLPEVDSCIHSLAHAFSRCGLSIQSLGGKDPLEEGMAAHSSVLAWRIPWTEKPGRLRSLGLQRVGHD